MTNSDSTEEVLARIRDYRLNRRHEDCPTSGSGERRRLDHLPPGAERRESERRSVVLNSTIRPAGGPNGTYQSIEPAMKGSERILTDEDELAALDRACEDENRTLKVCCKSAALEIWRDMNLPRPAGKVPLATIAGIIYKHMRNGREL